MPNKVVFIQKRSTRGGAQVALSRLLTAPKMRELNPLVITSDQNGWLPRELSRTGVSYLIERIPSIRSIPARLWSVRSFASKIASRLENSRPLAIIANSHDEAVLAYAVAKKLNTKSAVILRDPDLTKETLEKYGWNLPDHTLAVGINLAALAKGCNASIPITTIYDAVTDFGEPTEMAPTFPSEVLVVGTRQPRKGWKELIEAIDIAAQTEPGILRTHFVFSGSPPHGHIARDHIAFAEHTDMFFERLLKFKLVINPSRAESFGLAPAEALAAGIPLLSTHTGIFRHPINLPKEWAMPWPDPESMAKQIAALYRNWSTIRNPVPDLQNQIKILFSPEKAAEPILGSIERMQRGE
jgi:glycosyltransferase involved in cell wall biosynthesis